MTDKAGTERKPKTFSRYAQKSRQPIEWSHDRHNPPVAGCSKC